MKTRILLTLPLCALSLLITAFRHADHQPPPQPENDQHSENIAPLGTLTATAGSRDLDKLLDNNNTTPWSAQDYAPQWIAIDFDRFHLVHKIELVITQSSPGPSSHQIWLGDTTHTTTLHQEITNLHTQDGQTIEIHIDPPRRINNAYILTTQSSSWIGWYEIRVLTAPSAPWRLQKFADGLELPVQTTHAGDDSGRLFVVEHKGRIRILKNGRLLHTPFLDIAHKVKCCGEQGLFSLAFPPNHRANRRFYISYTNKDGHTVISRYTTAADPDKADPDSEQILLTIQQPNINHNGGTIAFGPNDGYLYVGSGDGGGLDDKHNAQDPNTLLGKILRIDVESNTHPYAIPPDNPFIETAGHRPEIWALGIRNPWGFAFDRQTGALYIPDVGENRREEVNYQPPHSAGGQNYGWPAWEGNYCTRHESGSCNNPAAILPVTVYEHGTDRCAIAGGAVLDSAFLFTDFCSGRIWTLQPRGDRWKTEKLLTAPSPISNIGADAAGNIYTAGYFTGTIHTLTQTPETRQQKGPAPNPKPCIRLPALLR